MITYRPKNTCSSQINYEIKDGIVTHVDFVGGCRGNLQAVSKLCVGKTPQEIIGVLEGINCRAGTSCPDQLAKALKQYMDNNKQ